MNSQIIMYSLLTVMNFTTPEECQMWSDKIYGDGFKCFKSYKYKEWYAEEIPLDRPDVINTIKIEKIDEMQ